MLAPLLAAALGLLALALWQGLGRHPVPSVGPTPAEAQVLDTARSAASPVMPDSSPGPDAVPRFARTWTRVHDRRGPRADVVAVLLPGDTVLADSLERGWWRVALDGRVLGYVWHRTLAGN